MTNGNESNKDSSDYSFFITYKPNNVKFVSKEEFDLIKEYYLIISALRNNLMSVKDIHNLYQDQKTGDYTYTLKTIYRHLEKLESAGLVTAAGYREKIGSRSCEKVYCRTAKIFFPKSKEKDIKWWETENGERYAQVLRVTLAELLETLEPNKDSFYNLFKQFSTLYNKTEKELLEKVGKNSEIADFLSQIDIDKLNSVTNLIIVLKVFLQQPDLLNQIQSLLNIKKSNKK